MWSILICVDDRIGFTKAACRTCRNKIRMAAGLEMNFFFFLAHNLIRAIQRTNTGAVVVHWQAEHKVSF